AALAGADVAAPIGRQLLQHDARRHKHPAAVNLSIPLSVVIEIGTSWPAIAFDPVDRAVAAREARAGLSQFLIPVVVLAVALPMPSIAVPSIGTVTILCQDRGEGDRACQHACKHRGRNDTKRVTWHEGCHLSQTLGRAGYAFEATRRRST